MVVHYRAIFISDVHLGTRGSKTEFLLDFLKQTESDTLYLVGDIFDGWRLRKHWYWTQSHNDVIQKLLRKARKGTRIVYTPGNHDECLRNFLSMQFGGIEIADSAIHVTADGKRLLVVHGDAFDGVIRYAKWLAFLGDSAYTAIMGVSHLVNILRRKLGYPYWSLSAYLKNRVKNAVEFVGRYEATVISAAQSHDVQGVVCGHIHRPEMREMGGLIYCNAGDWVESCSALVEHFDGRLELLHWMEERALDPLTMRALAA